MSTYLYLTCLDHDPPLLADGESGQHTYDLPTIRDAIAHRDYVARAAENGDGPCGPSMRGQFGDNTGRFLAAHKTCRIGITDEYGSAYATTGDSEKPIPAEPSTTPPTSNEHQIIAQLRHDLAAAESQRDEHARSAAEWRKVAVNTTFKRGGLIGPRVGPHHD